LAKRHEHPAVKAYIATAGPVALRYVTQSSVLSAAVTRQQAYCLP